MASPLRLKLQLVAGDVFAIGPGKATLLEAIAEHGSIAAGARAMDMSYRRAWILVDQLNHAWREPVVASAAGGRRGGGAQLTPFGAVILAAYRALERRITQAAQAAPELAQLQERLGAGP